MPCPGGHHHNTAEGSKGERILVDPVSQAALMAEAGKLRDMLAAKREPAGAELKAIRGRVAAIVEKVTGAGG